jgi:hypothetical protein
MRRCSLHSKSKQKTAVANQGQGEWPFHLAQANKETTLDSAFTFLNSTFAEK